ncbi:hypothetical protein PAXRUDRAFT_153577, partial [Paxillus rubicundulus Ve08.2h10]
PLQDSMETPKPRSRPKSNSLGISTEWKHKGKTCLEAAVDVLPASFTPEEEIEQNNKLYELGFQTRPPSHNAEHPDKEP